METNFFPVILGDMIHSIFKHLRVNTLILLLSLSTWAWGKPPQIAPRDVKVKVEEILKAHVSYKSLTAELMERTLQNFVDELDPTKTYFLEEEVAPWTHPSDAVLQRALSPGLKAPIFPSFRRSTRPSSSPLSGAMPSKLRSAKGIYHRALRAMSLKT